MLSSNIIDRKVISLNETQSKMIASGWGEEALNNSVVEKITYLSDGLKVKGFIAYPKNQTKKYPCVIWNRGGAGNRGAIDAFTARGIYGQLASWGYVVFASQYRGNAGGEGKEEFGGKDVNDVLNLIPLAEEIPNADKNKWGIEGWSRGGMMAYIALTKTKIFRCAILVGAISNLEQNPVITPDMRKFYVDQIGEDNFETELKKRSAVNFVSQLPNIPYLIIHGGDDKIISPDQSVEMSNKLTELKIYHKLTILENGDHYLKKHKRELDELRRMWFDKYLV